MRPHLLYLAGLLLISVISSLGLSEMVLHLAGFSYRLYPERVQFGYPRAEHLASVYKEDPQLFWVPRDYEDRLRALIEKPPDILFTGDSCTEFGTYDTHMASLLAEHNANLSVAKLGVGGWSTYQALAQLRGDISRIRPKVMTIYYGWNDHWIGFGIEDKDIARLHSPVFMWLANLRLVQLGMKAYVGLAQAKARKFPRRVSLSDFRSNLRALVTESRQLGITPVLLTAPSAHRLGKEPRYLLGSWLRDLKQLVPLHQRYVTAVREVAQKEGAQLCDLEAKFNGFSEDELTRRYFKKDGIHLTDNGYNVLARFLFDCIKEGKLFDNVLKTD